MACASAVCSQELMRANSRVVTVHITKVEGRCVTYSMVEQRKEKKIMHTGTVQDTANVFEELKEKNHW
eukprot:2854108-Amphidinium_carterae.1